MLSGKNRQGTVRSHGGNRLCTVPCHGQDHSLILLIGVAVSLLKPCPLLIGKARHLLVGDLQLL